MDDLENTQESDIKLIPIVLASFFFLIAGLVVGRWYQSYKDKAALDLLTSMQNSFAAMKGMNVPDNDLFREVMFKQGGWSNRINVDEDEGGFAYIELHYLPRAVLPKMVDETTEKKKPILDIHEDVGDPEHDGKAPTDDADDWAKDK